MFAVSGHHTQAGIERIRLANLRSKVAEVKSELRSVRRMVAIESSKLTVRKPRTTFERIESRACKIFKVTLHEIRANRRHKRIVIARQFVMYWTCRRTDFSLPMIGRLMGGRDHTTILHGRNAYVEKRAKMGRYLRSVR